MTRLAFIRANLHLTDKELAAALGLSRRQVQWIREREGLIKNYNFKEGRTCRFTECDRLRMIKSPHPPSVVAKIYGANPSYVTRLRKRHNHK